MFSNLFFSTLPLFGLVFIGYSLGKFSLFNDSEAKIFSKLVAIVVVPAFGIKIIGNFNYEFINWKLYFCYLLGQGIIYFIAFIIAKKFFNRSTPECIIIGLVSSSSNHLFFIPKAGKTTNPTSLVNTFASVSLNSENFPKE